MSEEEMKVVDYWKNYMEILHWNTQLVSEHHMKLLLDLIEKQSKEIEELKTEKAKRSWVHIKENGEVEPLFYVSKAKIKAKIEEIDKEIKVKREIAKNPMDRVSGRLLTDSIVELEKVKRVLQSLLEEEE